MLRVTIWQARRLPGLEGFGDQKTCDAVVSVCAGGKSSHTHAKLELHTTVKEKAHDHAVWNERFFVPLARGYTPLRLVLEDHNVLLPNEQIGVWRYDTGASAVDETAAVARATMKRVWVPLSGSKAQRAGTELQISVIPFFSGSEVVDLKSFVQAGPVDDYDEDGIVDGQDGEAMPGHDRKRSESNSIASGSDGGGGSGWMSDDDDFPAESDDGPAADDEETFKEDEERKAQEAAEQEERERRMSEVRIRDGDYMVQVHVIEVRDLHPEDANGSADPIVFVECFSKTKHTRVKQQCTSAVFDQIFYFELKDMTRPKLEVGSIEINVYDADMPLKSTAVSKELIGGFATDFETVYYEDAHELYRTWAPLIDYHETSDSGTQGYLLFSISILGPNDKPVVHNREKEKQAERKQREAQGGDSSDPLAGMAVLTPHLAQSLNFLVVDLFRAEGLPAMDRSALGRPQGLDAFCKVQFGVVDAVKSKVVSTKAGSEAVSLTWNTSLWIPFMAPSFTNSINVSVWDKDRVSSELIASIPPFNLRAIKAHPAEYRLRWANLYGAPVPDSIVGNAAKRQMNRNPELASTYRGRILLGLRIHDNRGKTKLQQQVYHRKVHRPPRLPQQLYELRAIVYSASDLPRFKIKGNKFQVRVSMGNVSMLTQCVTAKHGLAVFPDGLMHNSELSFPVGADVTQFPDIIVHLFRGNATSGGEPICFCRFPASQFLLPASENDVDQRNLHFNRPAEWVVLKKDAVIDAVDEEDWPGNLLLRLGFGPVEIARDARWHFRSTTQTAPYRLWVHVFQGRNLPPADDDGLLDPYVKAMFAGEHAATHIRPRTRDPQYWQTLALDVQLPPVQELMPQLTLQVKDHDRFSGDDLVGVMRVPLAYAVEVSQNRLKRLHQANAQGPGSLDADELAALGVPRPKWYALKTPGGGPTPGQVLMSFTLIRCRQEPARSDLPAPPPLQPRLRTCYLDMFVLGLRELSGGGLLGVQKPFMELRLGDEPPFQSLPPTKKPCATNPNFCRHIHERISVPADALFAPCLNITVKDSLLGGLSSKVLGTMSIPLDTKVRTSNGKRNAFFKRSGGAFVGGNPYAEREVAEPVPAAPVVGEPVADLAQFEAEHNRAQLAIAGTARRDRGASEDDAEEGLTPETTLGGGSGEHKSELPATPNRSAGKGWDEDDPKVTTRDDDGDGDGDGDGSEDVETKEHDGGSDAVHGARLESLTLDSSRLVGRDEESSEDEDHRDDVRERERDEPYYLLRRMRHPEELESKLRRTVFESYPIYTGAVAGDLLDGGYRQVGYLKAIVRVVDDADYTPPEDIAALSRPQPFQVRVYVINGLVTAKDATGFSDPYLRLALGDTAIVDKERIQKQTLRPQFFHRYDFQAVLPGTSELEISVFDHDTFSTDELLGSTIIDLEDRWFSQRWQRLGQPNPEEEAELAEDFPNIPKVAGPKRPLENRTLWIPTCNNPRGHIACWVDIFPAKDAKLYPPIDIAPPPQLDYEVRVVVWKARETPVGDEMTGMTDLYFKCSLGELPSQETDIHLRCAEGQNASFNWRMKWAVKLPVPEQSEGSAYLRVQAWDFDVLYNDCLAECTFDLSRQFQRAYRRHVRAIQHGESGEAAQVYEVFTERRKQQVEERRARQRSRTRTESRPVVGMAGSVNGGSGSGSGSGSNSSSSSSARRAGGRFGSSARWKRKGEYQRIPDADEDKTVEPATDIETGQLGEAQAYQARARDLAATEAGIDLDVDVDDNGGAAGDAGAEIDSPTTVTRKRKAKKKKQQKKDADNKKKKKRKKQLTMYDRMMDAMGWGPKPENSEWLPLTKSVGGVTQRCGEVLVSIEIMPQSLADNRPAGLGRGEPNQHPVMPEPEGRPDLTQMWNPLYACRMCIGEKLCAEFACIICCCGFLALYAVAGPSIMSFIQLLAFVPYGLGYYIAGASLVLLLAFFCYCRYKCKRICCTAGRDEEDENEAEGEGADALEMV